MTGPIINPWWLYLYSIVGGISTVLEVSLMCGLIAFTIIAGFRIAAAVDPPDDEILDIIKKFFKRIIIGMACITISYILVPNQDLMMKMFILNNITYENLETVGGVTKEGFDYVMESIDELINKETVEEEEE